MGHHLKCTMHNNSTRTVHTAKLTIFTPKGEFSWQHATIYKQDRSSNLLSATQYRFLSAMRHATSLLKPRTHGKLRRLRVHSKITD